MCLTFTTLWRKCCCTSRQALGITNNTYISNSAFGLKNDIRTSALPVHLKFAATPVLIVFFANEGSFLFQGFGGLFGTADDRLQNDAQTVVNFLSDGAVVDAIMSIERKNQQQDEDEEDDPNIRKIDVTNPPGLKKYLFPPQMVYNHHVNDKHLFQKQHF